MSLAAPRAAALTPADRDRDSNMSRCSAKDGEQREIDEELLLAQRNMQMLDLGTGRREFVTTHDKPVPCEFRVSTQQLLRARKVEEEGTEAARLFQENKSRVTAWNSISTQIAQDNADREQLDELMNGQSHRAKLNKEIKEKGGQSYGEVSKVRFDDFSRRGRGGGAGGRGMSGRSGRGAPMHVPVTSTNGRISATAPPSIPTRPKADRPLDPAIDPDREYSYKTKKGGKTISTSYNGGQAVRVNPNLGREKGVNDARAAMVGNTVCDGPAAKTKAKSDQSGPPHALRETSATVALNDEAFLKVMNNMTAKPKFSQHVQKKSKPAPNSKAAALVEQPAKTNDRRAAASKKPASALAISSETPAEAYRHLEARNKSSNTHATVRLAPTHEFGFPPPNIKSGEKKGAGDNISVHTDGVESASTFNSADFKTQSTGEAGPRNSRNHGTIVNGGDLTRKYSSATSEAVSASNGSGIHLLPPPSHAASNQKDDLITLEDGIGQTSPVVNNSSNDAPSASYANSTQSPGVPEIMDEDLDPVNLHSPLTPRSSIAPRSIIFRGARYTRDDLITGQKADAGQAEDRPEGSRQQNTQPTGQAASLSSGTNSRARVTNERHIGLQTLQENSASSILGEHNLPGHSAMSRGPTSHTLLASSRWANPMLRSTPANASFPSPSLPQTHLSLVPAQKPDQHHELLQKSQTNNTEMAGEPTACSVQQQAALSLNLAASKYAIQGVQVATCSLPVESLTFHKSAEQGPVYKSDKASNAFQTASRTASVGQGGEDRKAFDPTLQVPQENLVPTMSHPSHIPNMPSNASSKTGSSATDKTRQTTENSTASAPKPSRKPANLIDSIWSTANSGMSPLAALNQTFESQTRQSPFTLISDHDDSKEKKSAVSDDGVQRKRNPFGITTQLSEPARLQENKKFASAIPAQPVDGSVMAERSGNIPSAGHTPMTLRDRIGGTGVHVKDQSSMFNFSELQGSKSTNHIQLSWANGTTQGRPVEPRLPSSKPNPNNSLMKSKYAPSNASTSSFRKGRRASEESEI